MRVNAVVAAALSAAVILGVSSHQQKVHAEPTKTQSQNQTQKPVHKMITVESGDYLEKIAKRNKSTVQRVFAANTKVKDPDLIYPGQKLRIPSKGEKLKKRVIPGNTAPTTTAVLPASNKPVVSRQPIKQVQQSFANVSSGSVWDRLAQCESGGNWSINTGNGFYGGLQFTLSSWQAVGGSGYPNHASRDEQIARAKILQSRQGWGAWPACSAQLGLY